MGAKKITSVTAVLFVSIWLTQESEVPIHFEHETSDGTFLYSQRNILDKKIVSRLPELTGPIWTGDQSAPPLSAVEAIRLGVKKRKELLDAAPESFEWKLVSATLVPWNYEKGYWYWTVNFRLDVTGGSSGGPETFFRVFVLMDGAVVEPEVSDEK